MHGWALISRQWLSLDSLWYDDITTVQGGRILPALLCWACFAVKMWCNQTNARQPLQQIQGRMLLAHILDEKHTKHRNLAEWCLYNWPRVSLLRDIKGKGILLCFMDWYEPNPRVLSVLTPVAGKGAAECKTSTLVVPTPRASPAAKDPNPRDLPQAKLWHAVVAMKVGNDFLLLNALGHLKYEWSYIKLISIVKKTAVMN